MSAISMGQVEADCVPNINFPFLKSTKVAFQLVGKNKIWY